MSKRKTAKRINIDKTINSLRKSLKKDLAAMEKKVNKAIVKLNKLKARHKK
jgi:hypothetical protein